MKSPTGFNAQVSNIQVAEKHQQMGIQEIWPALRAELLARVGVSPLRTICSLERVSYQ